LRNGRLQVAQGRAVFRKGVEELSASGGNKRMKRGQRRNTNQSRKGEVLTQRATSCSREWDWIQKGMISDGQRQRERTGAKARARV